MVTGDNICMELAARACQIPSIEQPSHCLARSFSGVNPGDLSPVSKYYYVSGYLSVNTCQLTALFDSLGRLEREGIVSTCSGQRW